MKSNKSAGRFMVAVGAVIKHKKTGKILLVKRTKHLDWQPGEWETVYGRMNQFEIPEEALKRELKEEIGIKVEIGKLLTVWHVFRGNKKTAENELVGITYFCQTADDNIRLSDEHSEYRWVTIKEALNLVKIKGIRRDILAYMRLRKLFQLCCRCCK